MKNIEAVMYILCCLAIALLSLHAYWLQTEVERLNAAVAVYGQAILQMNGGR